MNTTGRQLHLNLFLLGSEDYSGAWRHPRCAGTRPNSVDEVRSLVRMAERATLDSVFLADALAVGESFEYSPPQEYEPVTMLAALAEATERIGLIGTVSTGHTEPYNLARMLASLDHISGGRAGWNIVTTAAERAAQNFGQSTLEHHDVRYQRAEDYVELVCGLWDSWSPDAVIADTVTGRYVDPARVRVLDHEGPFYQSRGPLNVCRSPQGRPLLVQAGSSQAGMRFAARRAEVVFTAQPSFADATGFYSTIKRLVAQEGRRPEKVSVLPGVAPVVGSTEAEAARLAAELARLVVPETLIGRMSLVLGVDLSGHPLDEPLGELPPVDTVETYRSRAELVRKLIRRDNPTLRQLLATVGGSRGHFAVAGTPERIADHFEYWFEHGAADGFNVFPPLLPGGFADFAEQVVPELRRRGLFRAGYESRTLRGHYTGT